MIASDANAVLQYATETTRCIGLVREAELRESALLSSVEQHCMTESICCQALCQETAQRVVYETHRRLAAEARAVAMKRQIDAVVYDAQRCAEVDRKTIAMMHARICELELASVVE